MNLTAEQEQALQNLTKVFSLTASKTAFNRFFQDELADLESLNQRQDEINDEIRDLMQYSDTGAKNLVDLVDEFSSNEREIKRINNRLQMAQGLLVELGVTLV
jgi:predicted  nucleic acid-binding Zn-ribbon protein